MSEQDAGGGGTASLAVNVVADHPEEDAEGTNEGLWSREANAGVILAVLFETSEELSVDDADDAVWRT